MSTKFLVNACLKTSPQAPIGLNINLAQTVFTSPPGRGRRKAAGEGALISMQFIIEESGINSPHPPRLGLVGLSRWRGEKKSA